MIRFFIYINTKRKTNFFNDAVQLIKPYSPLIFIALDDLDTNTYKPRNILV